ncbi:Lin-37 [Cichlidogyrus casuarinus]|uniref:Lin-37 n=1 Tax=Cichlidogyrus casuarinus TaxID=1844966 RepID=A0ABD2PYA5_9PLAT
MSTQWGDNRWWTENEDADILYAREKLDQVLQNLKENPEKARESTKYTKDDMGRKESPDKKDFRSPIYKPSDMKRRKRRNPSDEEDYKESYVIKVFDRSVDFGQFSENASLYAIARAWIKDLNHGSAWNDVPNIEDDQENHDNLPDCHYALPKPNDGLTDNEVRIPEPLPAIGQPFVINVENPPKEMSPEGLLEQHINRWREIRQKWKTACHDNLERYMDSYVILKDMYDKYCKDLP